MKPITKLKKELEQYENMIKAIEEGNLVINKDLKKVVIKKIRLLRKVLIL